MMSRSKIQSNRTTQPFGPSRVGVGASHTWIQTADHLTGCVFGGTVVRCQPCRDENPCTSKLPVFGSGRVLHDDMGLWQGSFRCCLNSSTFPEVDPYWDTGDAGDLRSQTNQACFEYERISKNRRQPKPLPSTQHVDASESAVTISQLS